jgi:4-diphosphocytidyl-2C-methyl-D-erythritol kinase
MKRISASLTEMYYSAQKYGATARELDAIRYAAKQSGEGADKAEASFNAFAQRIRDFSTRCRRQYKSLLNIDVDQQHPLDSSAMWSVLGAAPGCRLARMSGSGATCFAHFKDCTSAPRATAEPLWITFAKLYIR